MLPLIRAWMFRCPWRRSRVLGNNASPLFHFGPILSMAFYPGCPWPSSLLVSIFVSLAYPRESVFAPSPNVFFPSILMLVYTHTQSRAPVLLSCPDAPRTCQFLLVYPNRCHQLQSAFANRRSSSEACVSNHASSWSLVLCPSAESLPLPLVP